MQQVHPRGSPVSSLTSILTESPGRPWIRQKANSTLGKTDRRWMSFCNIGGFVSFKPDFFFFFIFLTN